MKTECSLFVVLMILLASCGCIDTQSPVEDDSMQNGTAEGLPVNSSFTPTSAATGGTKIPVDLSQIEIRGGPNFSPNVTLISSILQNDPRTGILIENGWDITSINEPLQSWDIADPVRLEEWNATSTNEMNDKKTAPGGPPPWSSKMRGCRSTSESMNRRGVPPGVTVVPRSGLQSPFQVLIPGIIIRLRIRWRDGGTPSMPGTRGLL